MLRSERHKLVQIGMRRPSSHSMSQHVTAAKLRPVPGHLILSSEVFREPDPCGSITLRSKQGQQPQWQNPPWLWAAQQAPKHSQCLYFFLILTRNAWWTSERDVFRPNWKQTICPYLSISFRCSEPNPCGWKGNEVCDPEGPLDAPRNPNLSSAMPRHAVPSVRPSISQDESH